MVCDCSGNLQARRSRSSDGQVARRVIWCGNRAAVVRVRTQCMGESCGDRGCECHGLRCCERALQPDGAEQHYNAVLLGGMFLFLNTWTTPPQAVGLGASRTGRGYKRTFLLRDTLAAVHFDEL